MNLFTTISSPFASSGSMLVPCTRKACATNVITRMEKSKAAETLCISSHRARQKDLTRAKSARHVPCRFAPWMPRTHRLCALAGVRGAEQVRRALAPICTLRERTDRDAVYAATGRFDAACAECLRQSQRVAHAVLKESPSLASRAPSREASTKERVMKRFDDRTVIVTGGARGMGASHARGFVAEGANVVIADVLEQEGRTLADEIGEHAIFSRLDVTNDKDWAVTVAAAEDAFGPVSVLVNNAGIVRFGRIEETEPAVWRQVMEINVTGAYLGIRAVVSSMRKAGGGAIVNISSGAGFTATFGLAAYVSSKWGVRGLTKTAALELGRDNIRVNSIHPGAIRTPILANDAPDAAAMAATMEGAGVGLSAIPRIAEPEEITQMVLFVASDLASFSTGSEFIADGGLLLGPVPQHERAEASAA